MYVYTDDDLTTINRDYLGPKGKRLPWVASYRTYAVTLAVIVGWFLVFLLSGLPLNQWVGLLYVIAVASTVLFFVRRIRRDVSLWAMAKTGWQEVGVPRAAEPRPVTHPIVASVARYAYDAEPEPRWWEKGAQRLRTGAQRHLHETTSPGPAKARPIVPTRARS